MKVFLSHSSKDKDIVGKIYAELGQATAHYDVATFDTNGFLPEEILRALDESSTFVLFASKAALESSWVQGELKIAFLNWVKSGIRDVMVFLLREGERSMVPEWLQSHVIVEHPSPTHICLRIRSRLLSRQQSSLSLPPFYRYDELTQLEERIQTNADRMPKAMIISGPQGYGKKRLINELYSRHFPGVPNLKILLSFEDFSSEVDLYGHVLGAASLHSISELAQKLERFEKLSADERQLFLANEIMSLTAGNQVLLIDAGDSLLSESAHILPSIRGLIKSLVRSDCPRLIFLSARKPSYIDGDIINDVCALHLQELPVEKSKLLFRWWLNQMHVQDSDFVVDQLIDHIQGNEKQIEHAARLVSNLDIPQGLRRNRQRIFADLEKQANELLISLEHDIACVLVLAFISECGYVSESDLVSALANADGMTSAQIENALLILQSYGFVISDDISLRLPSYLVRSAKNLASSPKIADTMKAAWKHFAEIFGEFSADTESSIGLLTDLCLTTLKDGGNQLKLIESIILPSQCYRIARKYYDKGENKKALALCKKAYERRIALTDEGCLEVLKIQGLSASRLNDQNELSHVVEAFSEYPNSTKARRHKEFLLGFEARLAGKFDTALVHMNNAYQAKGNGDFHVLRELAFLSRAQDNFPRAKDYIRQAKSKAKANLFVLEMELKNELSMGEGYVIDHQDEILALIQDINLIERYEHKNFSFSARIEYQLAIRNSQEARRLISEREAQVAKLGQAIQMLKAQAYMIDKRFSEALEICVALKSEVDRTLDGQRHSPRPAITRLLVEAATGVSINSGIDQLRKCAHQMPKVITAKLKKQLYDAAAYGGHNLATSDIKFLQETN